jgi:hypothetical protein
VEDHDRRSRHRRPLTWRFSRDFPGLQHHAVPCPKAQCRSRTEAVAWSAPWLGSVTTLAEGWTPERRSVEPAARGRHGRALVQPRDHGQLLVAVSAAQLASEVVGMIVALRRRHPYDVFWMHGQPDEITRDTLLRGTALSAPVSNLLTHAAMTAVVARRPSRRAEQALGGGERCWSPGIWASGWYGSDCVHRAGIGWSRRCWWSPSDWQRPWSCLACEDPAGRPLRRQPSGSRATTGTGEPRRTLSGGLGTMAPHDRRA